jgi:dihydroorotate dehydrogenase
MFFINPPLGNYLTLPHTISIKGSYTLYPRTGLLTQVLGTLRYSFAHGGWTNRIGLRNPGLDYAVKNYDGSHIVSIAICEYNEIDNILQKIPVDMNIELNVSCPNHNIIKGNDNHQLQKFINKERKWCIIKLSPLTQPTLIDSYYNMGFRQFHCSNTLPLGAKGGLSGPALIPYTTNLVKYLRTKDDVTIIAGGGVRNVKIAEHYIHHGADYISASTVFFNPFVAIRFYLDMTKK